MAQMGTTGAVGGATMGAMGAATVGSIPFITLVFQTVGLGFILVLPAYYYKILLIVVLSFTVFSSYYSYRFHRNPIPFVLALIGSFLLYATIYFFASELGYWVAFLIMSFSAAWNYMTAKKRLGRSQAQTLTIARPEEKVGTR